MQDPRVEAGKGLDFLLVMLETDDGASYVGKFAFGTNKDITRFTKNTLFDEKIGGIVHLALGKSLPESGGGHTLEHGLQSTERRRDICRR